MKITKKNIKKNIKNIMHNIEKITKKKLAHVIKYIKKITKIKLKNIKKYIMKITKKNEKNYVKYIKKIIEKKLTNIKEYIMKTANKRRQIMNWIKVEDKMPEKDEYVLWLYEDKHIFYQYINKYWDNYAISYFLSGGTFRKTTGRITHWCIPVYPNKKEAPIE